MRGRSSGPRTHKMMTRISLSNMSKSYAGTPALEDVSLHLTSGRVHALMGENGAGKSTLIKLLSGVVPADRMEIAVDDTPVFVRSAADAHGAGFRFIHQELNIVPQITVAENILLGRELPTRFGFAVNWPRVRALASEALEMLGASGLDLNAMAGGLAADDKMLVKIASALVAEPGQDARLYVLDEPTAALTGAESEKLFAVIERLKARGAAILYVSHRMDEVMRICDDVTVLRDGRHVMTRPVAQTSKPEIIQAMTGKNVADAYPPRQTPIGADVVAQVRGQSRHLADLDFEIRAGEILGVAGLAEAGQTDLIRLFLGLERLTQGKAEVLGRPLPRNPAQAWERGIANIPRERRSEGLMLNMSIRSNVVLPHLSGTRASLRTERRAATRMGDLVRLKSEGPEQPVGQLSGGNQQKAVFARAVMGDPRLLLLEEPTRGVDVGAKWEIYQLVRGLSAKGCAVILTSSDLPELLGMCDRALVLQDGAQTRVLETGGLTQADLVARFYEPSERAAS